MKLLTHTNGFQYSVPETLTEAAQHCGTTQDTFTPWLRFDDESKETELQFGPVHTRSCKPPNSYGQVLSFTVDNITNPSTGEHFIFLIDSKDRSHYYNVQPHVSPTKAPASPNNFMIGQFPIHRRSQNIPIVPADKEMYLMPGGRQSISTPGSRYSSYMSGRTVAHKDDPGQIAVDLFNEHVLILKKLWRSELAALKKAELEAKAEAEGLTVKDIKEQKKFEQRVTGHVERTKKTMEIMPALIKARNTIDDFISKLNADEPYTSQDVSRFQSAMEHIRDSVGVIRHVGKHTL